jgi:hypothetical protein
MAIKMTTLQKYNYITKGYCKLWDTTTSIMAYFTGLDKFQIYLDVEGASIAMIFSFGLDKKRLFLVLMTKG